MKSGGKQIDVQQILQKDNLKGNNEIDIMRPALFLFFFIGSFFCNAHKSSFLVLGDLHYDLLEDHDMVWLNTKPDDLRQVTKEYTVFTEKNWNDFMGVVRQKVHSEFPSMKAIIQFGDLSEGWQDRQRKPGRWPVMQ
jgi:hypothetical protein